MSAHANLGCVYEWPICQIVVDCFQLHSTVVRPILRSIINFRIATAGIVHQCYHKATACNLTGPRSKQIGRAVTTGADNHGRGRCLLRCRFGDINSCTYRITIVIHQIEAICFNFSKIRVD